MAPDKLVIGSFPSFATLPVYREGADGECAAPRVMPYPQDSVWMNRGVLRFAAAGAGLPRVPIAKHLHLLVEARLFHLRLDFRASEALPEGIGTVGDTP